MAALEGDLEATKLLLGYALGRPQQAVELTGADGEPLGVNFAAVTTIVLNALAGPEHAEARVRIAADLMRLGRCPRRRRLTATWPSASTRRSMLDELGFEPVDWQRRVMRSQSRRLILNIHRQGGQSRP